LTEPEAGREEDGSVTDQDKGGRKGAAGERRPVSLFSAAIIVIANMIGIGVFTTLGFQVASLQSPFAVLMLWVLGGVGAFCGALCYGELGAMMPRSGGEYTYLSNIYHPAIGFLSGWVSMVAGFAAPIALAAMALGEYGGAIVPGVDKTVIAVSIIVILSLVHLTDVRFGCHFQNLFTGGKILLIVAFIGLGFGVTNPQAISLAPSRSDLGSLFSPAFAISLVYVFYAYSGWNSSSYIAGEILKPEKNLPISLFLGAAFVSLCYCLINYVFLYTVPMGALAGQIDVGYLSAKAIFGGRGGAIMTGLICLALISSLSSLIMVGPRVTQTMSEDLGSLRWLAKRNARGAPVFAIILQAGVAIFLTLTATFNAVLTYVGFTLALFASLAVLGVFVWRVKHPEVLRPFKTWGYPVTPAIFLVLYGWMIVYLFIERPLPSVCGLLTVASGLLLYKLLAATGLSRSQGKIIEKSMP
jgi:basic amino acid/polyamine antiporter, APA family